MEHITGMTLYIEQHGDDFFSYLHPLLSPTLICIVLNFAVMLMQKQLVPVKTLKWGKIAYKNIKMQQLLK